MSPVVNTIQARIELSAAQFAALVDHVHANYAERDDLPPMIYVEETNLPNTVVIGGKGMPTTLIDHNGSLLALRGSK